MEGVCQEIGIHWHHVRETSVQRRYQLICDKSWLQKLEQSRKIAPFPTWGHLNKHAYIANVTNSSLPHPWTKVLVQIYKKQTSNQRTLLYCKSGMQPTTAMALSPKDMNSEIEGNDTFTFTPLSYSQAIYEVAQTNFRNAWKLGHQKYSEAHIIHNNINNNESIKGMKLLPHNVLLQDIVYRLFRCPIIHYRFDRERGNHQLEETVRSNAENSNCGKVYDKQHSNIMSALIAIETTYYIAVIFYPPCPETTLYDCITFSPAILNRSYNKPLFIVFQLFQVLKYLQKLGLLLGEISLQDIYLNEDLWIKVIPHLESNIIILNHNDDHGIKSESNNGNHKNPVQVIKGKKPTTNGSDTSKCMLDIEKDDYEIISQRKLQLNLLYDSDEFNLRDYCELWCNGQLSNYDYLTLLNNACGRSLTNPTYHHIMPWVTDFSSRSGLNWRDLTRSKYRLNKGDTHLDLMFTHGAQIQHNQQKNICSTGLVGNLQVPHHVSDFLSDITYFVYMARRTPQHILCEYVRPIWVPAEYPVSIQRLQEWSPDECIPEFYSNPMIFKSIHEDLPDLEIPNWATCPEDFIVKHREALESQYVDERLHHWIDLNFGYKLTGKAAIKAKNVCLSMVDKHQNLCQRGIVQLFTYPHPPKQVMNMSWFGPQSPRLQHLQQKLNNPCKSNSSLTKDVGCDYQRLAKSTENLCQPPNNMFKTKSSVPTFITHPNIALGTASSGSVDSPLEVIRNASIANTEYCGGLTSSNFYTNKNFIELPKDYNPVQLLQTLETTQVFLNKTFPKQHPTKNASQRTYNSDLLFDSYSPDHSFTNQLFSEIGNNTTQRAQPKSSHRSMKEYLKSEIIERKKNDLHIMGCIIVELFAMNHLRPLVHLLKSDGNKKKLNERIKSCQTIKHLYKNYIPKSLISICENLLYSREGSDNWDEVMCAKNGLPPLDASQILQNIYQQILLPFPATYYQCYGLLRSLHAYDEILVLLDFYTHFTCNGIDCKKYWDLDSKRIRFERRIAELQVTTCCALLRGLLTPQAATIPSNSSILTNGQFPIIDIILPHIIELLNNPHTSILTAWYLFDPVAQSLGRRNTQKYLLCSILKLYEHNESTSVPSHHGQRMKIDNGMNCNVGSLHGQMYFISNTFRSRKSIKLYHHSFLLRLIVRFGLNSFLQHFITPLIEAVGGYKDMDECHGLHCSYPTSGGRKVIDNNTNMAFRNIPPEEKNAFEDKQMNTVGSMQEIPPFAVTERESVDEDLSKESKILLEDIFIFDEDNVDDNKGDNATLNSDYIFNKSVEGLEILKSSSTTDIVVQTKEEQGNEHQHISGCNMDVATSAEGLTVISELIYDTKVSNNSLEDGPSLVASPVNRPHNIAIPLNILNSNQQLNAIHCDIGSRKSTDSIDFLQMEENKTTTTPQIDGHSTQDDMTIHVGQQKQEVLFDNDIIDYNDCKTQKDSLKYHSYLRADNNTKLSSASFSSDAFLNDGNHRIAEMCGESLVWLSHRLGPVLTSKFITKNLLKMLTLCYVGQENLLPEVETGAASYKIKNAAGSNTNSDQVELYHRKLQSFSVFDGRVNGDENAAYILECLMSIAGLYGEKIVLLQYIPHITEIVASGLKRISGNLEGALISTLQLMKYLIPCLKDETIMEHLSEIFLDTIITPILNSIGSTHLQMPSGYLGRSVLTRKLLDVIYMLGLRIGADMTRERLCLNIIRPFFSIFDKASLKRAKSDEINLEEKLADEISDVFCSALAHTSYLIFLRFLGEQIMRKTLLNFELVISLCHDYEEPLSTSTKIASVSSVLGNYNHTNTLINQFVDNEEFMTNSLLPSINNSFGRQVIGNRIEIQKSNTNNPGRTHLNESNMSSQDMLDLVAYKFDQMSTTRYLKGNWLAYWRHEITRSDKDECLNLKQIKLQSFIGHTNSIRAIHTLDNENSFISASKDKTVKLWSLRSEGDGTKATSPQFTYLSHKKPIHSLTFLESLRLVVSCDSGVHIWDPFIGRPLGILETAPLKNASLTVVKCLPSPSPIIVAGTADASVRIIDARSMQFANDWKVNVNSQLTATVRCLTISPSGYWLAVGLSSGCISMIDIRMGGTLMRSWQPMECDLLQLVAVTDQLLVSSALDHSLAVWHSNDGILHYQLTPPLEPAHYLQTIDSQLIYATTGNRIGIYNDLNSSHALHTVSKLHTETFKGVLTSLSILPLNRAFLAGNESGNITLLC